MLTTKQRQVLQLAKTNLITVSSVKGIFSSENHCLSVIQLLVKKKLLIGDYDCYGHFRITDAGLNFLNSSKQETQQALHLDLQSELDKVYLILDNYSKRIAELEEKVNGK